MFDSLTMREKPNPRTQLRVLASSSATTSISAEGYYSLGELGPRTLDRKELKLNVAVIDCSEQKRRASC